jgi:hypothetical protein
MKLNQDCLTLDGLLSDPLTQLVMRSDKLTAADVRAAFAQAQAGLLRRAILPDLRPAPAVGADWLS